MDIDLHKFEEEVKAQKSENQAFFKKLKKKRPKNLDYQFHQLHDEVFSEVDCLSCANCCKTTGPLFTESDINRLSKHFKIKPAAFIDSYLRTDEDGDFVLQSTPCPFLGSDNYCSVYEVRPKACREYPHTNRNKMHQILNLTLKNSEMCPAVLEIVNRFKKI